MIDYILPDLNEYDLKIAWKTLPYRENHKKMHEKYSFCLHAVRNILFSFIYDNIHENISQS